MQILHYFSLEFMSMGWSTTWLLSLSEAAYVKQGCHLHKLACKCAHIYTMAEQLDFSLNFMQAPPTLLQTHKYSHIYEYIYASGNPA
jgi:hypothetical protein